MALTWIAALAAAALTPQGITADEFLARAEPLLRKSRAALMFSSDARALLKVAGQAAQQSRVRLDAERAAGKPMTTCLPPKGKAKLDTAELVGYLRRLPVAQRRQTFEQAFAGYLRRKYPC